MAKILLNHPKAKSCRVDGGIPLSFNVAQVRPGTKLSTKQTLELAGSSPAGYQNPLLSGNGRR